MTNWLTEWLTYWLTPWLAGRQVAWLTAFYKPLSMSIVCPSNMVEQYWVSMFQTKLNNGIEH